jgi:L-ribulose-5-phosphate 3-epimerase
MTTKTPNEMGLDSRGMNRRAALRSTLAAVGATAVAQSGQASEDSAATKLAADSRRSSAKKFRMKKSINLWAFPYPGRMTLRECLQLAKESGFDGIELNYDLENDLSPNSTTERFRSIRKMAEEIGIAISGLCSFLYWPYSLTENDPERRNRGWELARLMIEAAHELGTENVLTIAGSTYIPWIPDREPVPIDVCDRRARESIGRLIPLAEKNGVYLNIENIVFNGYLTTPGEMNAFVDSFGSKHIRVHFDTGNVMLLILTIMSVLWYCASNLTGGGQSCDLGIATCVIARSSKRTVIVFGVKPRSRPIGASAMKSTWTQAARTLTAAEARTTGDTVSVEAHSRHFSPRSKEATSRAARS